MILKNNITILLILSLVLIIGCSDKNITNENDPLLCTYTDIIGTCCSLEYVDCTGICFGTNQCLGCTDSLAINLNKSGVSNKLSFIT